MLQEASNVVCVVSLGRANVEEVRSVFAQVLLLLFLAMGVEEGKQIQKARIGRVRYKAGVVACQVLGNSGKGACCQALGPKFKSSGATWVEGEN